MQVAAIIAAGGTGSRVGAGQPKQFVDLGGGSDMMALVLETFFTCAPISEIVIALPPDSEPRDGSDETRKPLKVVAGGARRQDSVANALAQVSDDADIVVIHDAARPFVTADLIERTIRAAQEHGAAIAALPATDTVKQATDRHADGTWRIRATLPRDTIYLAQTPQAFKRDVLADAMSAASDATFTDEAMLVERAGYPVHIVQGDAGNIKVTTAHDLTAARARVRESAARQIVRVGTGYDLHRLVEGRPLILAGVRIPFDRGLQGHSDADIVCHAVTDAILGAAALGDIGRFFPDTDAQWKNADSIRLLQAVVADLQTRQCRVSNVDVTIIAERPKLQPYVNEMRANLARTLAVDVAAVSIKGKTNEGVDATGRGEAMACHAVALVTSL